MTRDEAIELLNDLSDEVYNEDCDGYEYYQAINIAIEALEPATPIPNDKLINFGDIGSPTIKPLERQRGEWSLNIDDWFGDCYKCSVCGEEFVLNEGTPKDNGYNYCPNCGADMRDDND